MTNDPKIAPRIVDGEPVCSWIKCPSFRNPGCACEHLPGLGGYIIEGDPCIPGLRAQRDDLAAELRTRTEERDAATEKLTEIHSRLQMARDCLSCSEHWKHEQAENQAMRHIDSALSEFEEEVPK
jgi:hypothetical protein